VDGLALAQVPRGRKALVADAALQRLGVAYHVVVELAPRVEALPAHGALDGQALPLAIYLRCFADGCWCAPLVVFTLLRWGRRYPTPGDAESPLMTSMTSEAPRAAPGIWKKANLPPAASKEVKKVDIRY